MTKEEKIALIAKTIEADSIKPETLLNSIDTWDSLSRLSILIMFNNRFNKTIDAEKFATFRTVQDILDEMAE
jgi:acyl carrier protein